MDAKELLERYAAGERGFGGADLRGANLSGANLLGANLERADLEKAHLNRAHLGNARLESARLFGADLERADLGRANLFGANLAVAHLLGDLPTCRAKSLDASSLTEPSGFFPGRRGCVREEQLPLKHRMTPVAPDWSMS